jgi:hypothetical protein
MVALALVLQGAVKTATTGAGTGLRRRSRSADGCDRSSGHLQNRDRPMSRKLSPTVPSVASGKRPAPTRVKLRRVNCNEAIPYPPDGQTREWWHRLKNALGTRSSAFVAASVQQLIAAARLPNSGISEVAVNASLAFIEGAKPRDELECALVIQMACTHSATMAVLSRLGGRPRWRSKCCCDGVRGGPVAARLRNPGRGVTPAEERRLSNCPGRTCPCE